MRKRLVPLLALCLLLAACAPEPAGPAELDLDYIAGALTDSGYFPEPLEAQDPELVPGLLSLYEDRIEAVPEDVVQARFTMCLGIVADQFLLLEGADSEAAGRLETAKVEFREIPSYDYLVINDKVSGAVAEIEAILTAAECRVENRRSILTQFA